MTPEQQALNDLVQLTEEMGLYDVPYPFIKEEATDDGASEVQT